MKPPSFLWENHNYFKMVYFPSNIFFIFHICILLYYKSKISKNMQLLKIIIFICIIWYIFPIFQIIMLFYFFPKIFPKSFPKWWFFFSFSIIHGCLINHFIGQCSILKNLTLLCDYINRMWWLFGNCGSTQAGVEKRSYKWMSHACIFHTQNN